VKTEAVALPFVRSRASDFVALAKPRLNFLVVLTTSIAYYLGVGDRVDLVGMASTIAGTALVAASAAALNQLFERDVDGLMARTRSRPLPDGRVLPAEAMAFAIVLGLGGLGTLAAGANRLAALVAFATLASYVCIYTPMKRRSPISTIVGAVPGALPPVIGWAGARGDLSLGAWVLFGIVFVWQIPHFLAIAWMYRDEYARAGLPMPSVVDPEGRRIARQVMFSCLALLPLSLAPSFVGLTGAAYPAGAVILGVGFLFPAVRFALTRTPAAARALFLASIVYLPLLWLLMVVNRTVL
jgi:protoheme IX farnesyltransferase